ncbi:MAG TPA: trehalose-phosphatase [Phenylobacterium sp.]|nr:trehalose-phosphatase [Phenylobacterium sp.]
MSLESLTVALPAPRPLRLAESALFIDLDGTLAPIAERPQDVAPDRRRSDLLERLREGLDGRLAIVTGRTLADVDRILEGRAPCVAAVHGLVLRECDGTVHSPPPHPGLGPALEALQAFATCDSGLIVEEKGPSVALHFRLAQPRAAEARAVARRVALETGLALQEGDMVEELRTPGPAKGDSIRAFMETPQFHGAHPVFAGDDATDEHGFQAVEGLGGYGVLVGRARPTHARFGLRDVDAVMAWLEDAR